jgi:hypothetical protein
MTQNMPNSLRRLYLVMAVAAFLSALFLTQLSAAERFAMALAALILFASAASGYCAVYALFSRCRHQPRR